MTPAQVKALLHRARSSFRRAWDKAEGWALAPVVAIRGFFSEKSGPSQASSNLIGFTPSLSPLLAERVAAGAVIVAVALTGVPTAPTETAPIERRRTAVAAPIPDDPLKPVESLERTRRSEPDEIAVAIAPTRASDHAASDPDPVTKVLEAVGEQKLPKDHGNDDDDGGDGGEGIGTPGPASANPAVRKVKKVVQDLTH